MIRGEGICAGTSTTGTGTLTLAACPSPPGGIDFDVFLKAKGFVSTNALPISYTIIEYTDATFATLSKLEKGVGVLTLGASITAATLARTTPQVKITGGTYSDVSPTAISIGTAANVLVFIGASAADIAARPPWFDNVSGNGIGAFSERVQNFTIGSGISLSTTATGSDLYCKVNYGLPIVAKSITVRVATAYAGTTGTPVSSVYGRLYSVGSDGKPGVLLVDFGSFGTNPLNATGFISTTNLGTPYTLYPGEYWFNLFATFTGATGSVTTPNLSNVVTTNAAMWASNSGWGTAFATGGSSTAPTNANLTGYDVAVFSPAGAMIAMWINK